MKTSIEYAHDAGTVFDAPARTCASGGDTLAGGAPAVSEQAGTNEDENGAEGGWQNTGTP